MTTVLLVIICIFYLLYSLFVKRTNYWKKRNILHSRSLPLLGNMAPFIFGKKSTHELFQDLYDEFPNERFSGCQVSIRPALLIRDLKLIKQIAINDFDYFTDRGIFRVINEMDPVFSENLAVLTGKKWRQMRTTLSPLYSSTKMKFMFSLIVERAEEFTNYFYKQPEIVAVHTKDVFMKFTVDSIALTMFGLKVDSLNQPNNEFYIMSQDLCNVEGLKALKLLIYVICPLIAKVLGISVIPAKYVQYFSEIIKETVEVREEFTIFRPDMVHIYMDNKKRGKLPHLSFETMTAQAVMFFMAGSMNTTIVMSFMSYELAMNSGIQRRLQNEIDETLKRCKGKITYEELFQMKYLDMVLLETLRKWPTGPVFERKSVREYIIKATSPNEVSKVIEKGTMILVPYSAIMNDPIYFPDPTRFDPERFSDENKHLIVPGSFLPFGLGPRHCIGFRFAVMEIKLIIFYLLSKFDIIPIDKTPRIIVLSKLKLDIGSKEEIWLGLKHRTIKT